ncbi:GNAT family N-acetyltransferase [Sporolactobacillus laevolacticus]|uniref:GCN5 family acetyltransferase n=1 Tax=Sporolactobacillus laevolacticus DSM 442 TaxID=1395513 RepID=V6J5T5_9BACL|nr:GNAT family N-acetyltransferase [Sporolactobacillus laevolacticus]EST12124.1 GCN5 family acetyltransferase [Sporolactobacillus laevolacticus DSM 442]
MAEFRPICEKDRKEIEKQVVMRWGGRSMAIHGELIDVTNLPGFLAFENTQLVGMLTYRESSEGIEIISLDSFIEHHGIGSALLKAIVRATEEQNLGRLYLTTTNDNLHALHFYQKRGFTLSGLRIGAVIEARKLKPSIPLIGNDGIPIEHELELTYDFNRT